MSKSTFLTVGCLLLNLLLKARAQGTLEVSNLAQSPTGSAAVAGDAWIAQDFYAGSNPGGYLLNSVQLLMNLSSGNPDGFTVSVYSSLGGFPESPVASLGVLSGANPLAAGVYTYSSPGIYLAANTLYQMVVTDDVSLANGSFAWSAVNSFTAGNDLWIINNVYYTSTNGLNWSSGARGETFQMAIFATPLPEPSTWALAAIGAGIFGWQRRRKENIL